MPRFLVHTFGCQMNVHDSARLAEVLLGAGYAEAADADDADLIVLNTCSVREKAEHKLRSEVGRLARLKRARPHLTLAVAGCVAQQEGEALLRSLPAIDLVLGPDNIAELPGLLAERELGGPPRARTVFDLESPAFLRAQPGVARPGPAAFVTVMKGCNERCSFCIVPHTRGPERYRPAREIVAEVAELVAAGVREVTLLGQTVNSYADPERALGAAPGAELRPWTHTHPTTARTDESEFAALLRAVVAGAPGLWRLRYTSPHPRHLTWSLIRAHAELPALARHVHLPVQSGSDAVLRRMLRRYSVAEYLERTDALREALPGVTFSTDVIVGFPGETEADFAATVELIQRVGFVGVFGFKYSPRPFTPALKLGDDVPEAEKGARLTRLFEAADAVRGPHLTGLVGSTQTVLVEERGERGFTGRTERNEIAHLGAARDVVGELVEVRVVRAFKHSLEVELTDPVLRAPLLPAPARGDTGGAEPPGQGSAARPAPAPARRGLPVVGAP